MLAQLRFDNDATGFQELHQTIKSLCLQGMGQPLCGMESTGHYGIALRDFLTRLGHPVQVFNPLKVNRFRDFYIQPNKDDYRDTFVISQMLRYGERAPYTPLKPAIRALKQLTRYCTSLVRAKVKTQIRAILGAWVISGCNPMRRRRDGCWRCYWLGITSFGAKRRKNWPLWGSIKPLPPKRRPGLGG